MIHEIGHQIFSAFLAGLGVDENVTALRIRQRACRRIEHPNKRCLDDAVILTGATDTDVKVFAHKSLLTTPYQRYRHGDTNSPLARAEI
jgi:hypothetical protein